MVDESVCLMTPMEIAWGYLPGHIEITFPSSHGPRNPRDALERVVRGALRRPPCGVAFSGGRDSSAVLAIATHVARRDGLAEPVPITRVFPDAPATEEGKWQEAVVGHLGLTEWHRLQIHEELDVVGPLAAAHLTVHGVMWPPMIHVDIPLLETLRGGSLIDGEGGDEVLGVSSHRIAPVASLLRAPRPVRRRRVRAAVGAVAPARLRSHLIVRKWNAHALKWLRPAAREALIAALVGVDIGQPLSFQSSVRMVAGRRTQAIMAHNRRILARQKGVEVSSPLLHPGVVEALGHDGGVLGRGDRTAVLRRLVSDLLPDAVLARSTKATFGEAYMGRHTRELAERWTGEGVDPTLVNVEELRRSWLADEQNALTAALVQAAWLAGRRT